MKLFPRNRDLAEAPESVEIVVDASDLQLPVQEVNLRLDLFLAGRLHWRSRSSVQRLIKDGHVLVDASSPDHPQGTGSAAVETRPGRRLRHGSRVVIVIPGGQQLEVRTSRNTGQLVILYEDDDLVAVDKAPLQVVHPAGRHLKGTLIQLVHAHYGAEGLVRGARPRLCHRLDAETSGLVLVGKNPRMHALMMGKFEAREVEKEYLAIVRGIPDAPEGRITYPIAPARASRIGLRMAVRGDGLASRTDWRLVEAYGDVALVSCLLHSGRQHQIRVHMEAIGHPLVGDKIYGGDGALFQKNLDGELDAADLADLGMPRHALHNHRLAFDSPRSGERIEIMSPLARDMVQFLDARAD